MKEEIIITDICSAVLEKEHISDKTEREKWRALEYECALYTGRLVMAGANTMPKALTLSLGLKGRYGIFVGMLGMKGAQTVISLRLSDSEAPEEFGPTSEYSWTPVENMVEIYWRTAELDGNALIISKPDDYLPHTSSLAWIRLVPEEEREDAKPKVMSYHLDSDYFADDVYTSPEAATGRIRILEDGGCELVLQEGIATAAGCEYSADPLLYPRAAKYEWYHQNKAEIEKALINKAHSIGAKIYAAYRVQATQFAPPNDTGGINILFPDSYEGLEDKRCVSRDGRVLGMCSYAYPEVRARVIDYLCSFLDCEYDGLCLIFNRGTFVAFESPIADEIKRRYGIDAARLPMSDPRYYSVACSFVTEFMRELRSRLDSITDRRIGIHPVVFFTPEDSKYFGFDVETWVNEGLIDGLSQGLMRVYEDLDGCIDGEEFVDLDSYKSILKTRQIIKREFRATDQNIDLIIKGAEAFSKICDGKVDFYATLLWEAQNEDETKAITDRLKKIGVTRFMSWNANHKAKLLARLNAEKFYTAGSSEEYRRKQARRIRVMSVGGVDISQFDPNWKG